MTDYNYAVFNSDGRVTNIVVADSPDAEEALRLLLPEAHSVLLATPQTGPAIIDGDMVDGRFRPASPFPSWTFDHVEWRWAAPVPQPSGYYIWNEDLREWQPGPSPFASWVWDSASGEWNAPTPMPNLGGPWAWDETSESWVASGA